MIHFVVLPSQQSRLQYSSVLNQKIPFVTLQRVRDGPVQKTHNAYTVISFVNNHFGVDNVCKA